MFDQILSIFDRTPGLIGAALFDADNECLVHRLPAPYEPLLCAEVFEHFGAMSAIAQSLDEGPPESLVLFTDAVLVIVRTFDDAKLLVLAQPKANPAILHVACNSFGLRLAKLKSGIPAPAASAYKNMSSTWMKSQELRSASYPAVTSVPPVTSSTTQTLMGSRSGPVKPIPRDAVGTSFVRHVLRVFSKYMGDQAKFILRDELIRIDVRPQTLLKSQVGDLVDNLAKTIPSRRERRRFKSEALGA